MVTCADPLERRGSPLYLYYSILGQNLATIVPVSYFLTASHGQVRFDISTLSLATMLQKFAAMFVLSLWLESQPRDLACWHQRFFHAT
jgi:hypothetical protein